MSKVMVLLFGEIASSSIVDAVVAGANRVRFTEVDVRRAPTRDGSTDASPRPVPLRSATELTSVDGVVLVIDNESTAEDVRALLHEAAHGASLEYLVFAIAGDPKSTLSAVAAVAAAGGILVGDASHGSAGTPLERASRLGQRVAKLSGWVRHGLGHEAEHQHDASGHSHAHHH